jgi:mono/diheme cytochrome c family protein
LVNRLKLLHNINISLMKKIVFAASFISLGLGLISCGGASGDDPGHAYMPDMYYSRAYEVYGYNMVEGELDSLRKRGIFYNAMTVPGTVARGEMMPHHLMGDTTGLKLADSFTNMSDTASRKDAKMLKEGERLYLVNCGICHGPALDGNGPLYKGGEGPLAAKPATLNDAASKAWTDGHFFHVITFGKGQMGSYASQLKPEQRWMVINYIRSKQGGAAKSDTAKANTTVTTTTGTPDTAKAKQP